MKNVIGCYLDIIVKVILELVFKVHEYNLSLNRCGLCLIISQSIISKQFSLYHFVEDFIIIHGLRILKEGNN